MSLKRKANRKFLKQIGGAVIERCAERKKLTQEEIEQFLKKEEATTNELHDLFPAASLGIEEEKGTLDYFLGAHNDRVRKAREMSKTEEEKKRADECIVRPAQIVGRTKKGYVVIDADGKKRTVTNLVKGVPLVNEREIINNPNVLIHNGRICIAMTPEEYENVLKKYRKTIH